MNILAIVNAVVVVLGVPTILGSCIYFGRKLQILDSLHESTGKIKYNMKVMSDYLTRYHSKFDPKELQPLSPLQLTPEGNKLINDIGFQNVFGSHKEDFFKFIESENPKLKYDVESMAIKSVHVLQDKDYMNFLKVFFYNHPTRNLDNTGPTLGVYIRDRYLAEHPEITQ